MAETTTISNLPQITLDELTNDTLVPVENVDGTKAANLAQLRKKLNSLYVEIADADLNELKQDGIYECWGTTLNAPISEVAAWIIQTAEHEGVVVQNAFGLGTTSYSYVYRRRWDGVSWTAWENRILSLEDRVQALETSGAASDLAAVGRIEMCGYNDPLPNTLLCNGGEYSRTTYSRLYSKIGTTWGAGDGSTTFNVPNFVGAKLIIGNNIPIYGTGKGLRLTANASVGGYMFQHVFDSGAGEFDTSIYVTNYASDANVGAAQTGGLLPNNVVLGVPPKTAGNFNSGLQADLSGSNNVVYCIRY